MTVYVDTLTDWGWKLGRSCHMIADSDEELHAFAKSIGLKREWFQPPRDNMYGFPHYDLTARRRSQAVRKGAVEVDRRFVVDRIRERRNKARGA